MCHLWALHVVIKRQFFLHLYAPIGEIEPAVAKEKKGRLALRTLDSLLLSHLHGTAHIDTHPVRHRECEVNSTVAHFLPRNAMLSAVHSVVV